MSHKKVFKVEGKPTIHSGKYFCVLHVWTSYFLLLSCLNVFNHKVFMW